MPHLLGFDRFQASEEHRELIHSHNPESIEKSEKLPLSFFEKLKKYTQKPLHVLVVLQCGFLFGIGGLLRLLDHLREIEPIDHHFSLHFDRGVITRETTYAFANDYLITVGGILDILFDTLNFIKYLKQLWSPCTLSIQEEDLLYQKKRIEKKQALLRAQLETADYDRRKEIQDYWERLEKKKQDLVECLAQSNDLHHKREQRIRWLLAGIWSVLSARAVLFNTGLIMTYVWAGAFLPGFCLAMMAKSLSCWIEYYRIKKELEECIQVETRLKRRIFELIKPHFQEFEEDDKELDSLCLQHARRKDQRQLLQLECKQKKTDALLFLIVGALLTVAIVISILFPPLGASILATAAFIGIGFYIIPLIRNFKARQKKENETLTNVVEYSEAKQSKGSQLESAPKVLLKFKSSLHRLEYIRKLKEERTAPGEIQLAVLYQRASEKLQGRHENLQIAFQVKMEKFNGCYEYLQEKLLHSQTQFLRRSDLTQLNRAIKRMAFALIDMRAIQEVRHCLMVQEHCRNSVFILKLLNSVKYDTFLQGKRGEVSFKKTLNYLENTTPLSLSSSLKRNQWYKNYQSIQKRTERAYSRSPFWSLFSSQVRCDQKELHKESSSAVMASNVL